MVSFPKQWSGKKAKRPKTTRKPIPTNVEVIRKEIKLEKGPQCHNPASIIRLIGDTNESNIIVGGVSCKG